MTSGYAINSDQFDTKLLAFQKEQHTGKHQKSIAPGENVCGYSQPARTTHHHQQLERMDRNQLSAAGQPLWLRIPGSRQSGV